MTLLKKCVAVINNRSGHRHGIRAYTETLQQYMDRAGIVHQDIHIPNDDLAENLRRALPQSQALVVCGGDGTINSVVNLMATARQPLQQHTAAAAASSSSSLSPGADAATATTASLLNDVPLLLVPTGLHNSIATSLGVTSAQRAVSSLVIGRTVKVPLWAVRLHHDENGSSASASPSSASALPMRYMCSYVAAGTYATSVQRQARWKEAQEEYVSLPTILGTYAATALYTTVEHAVPRCRVRTSSTTTQTSNSSGSSGAPIRLVVASQMPQLQPGYSLTPTATYHRRCLTVTTAAEETTRLRMWHLLRREAREGYILEEDGVAVTEQVSELELEFCGSNDARTRDSTAGTDTETGLLVVDGECVPVPLGSRVSVAPTELTVQFIVS